MPSPPRRRTPRWRTSGADRHVVRVRLRGLGALLGGRPRAGSPRVRRELVACDAQVPEAPRGALEGGDDLLLGPPGGVVVARDRAVAELRTQRVVRLVDD